MQKQTPYTVPIEELLNWQENVTNDMPSDCTHILVIYEINPFTKTKVDLILVISY